MGQTSSRHGVIAKAHETKQEPVAKVTEDGKNRKAEPIWLVPWDGGCTTNVTCKFLVISLLMGTLGISIVAQLLGGDMAQDQKAVAILMLQVGEACALVNLLNSQLQAYQPLPDPWFKYDWADGRAVAWGAGGAYISLASVAAASQLNRFAGVTDGASASGPVQGLLQTGGVTAAALAMASILVAPALEELFWRGFFLPSLTRHVPTPIAVLVSSFAFAAAHYQPADLVPLTALGIVLGTVSCRSRGNLAAPTLTHIIYNGSIIAALGSAVS